MEAVEVLEFLKAFEEALDAFQKEKREKIMKRKFLKKKIISSGKSLFGKNSLSLLFFL